MPSREDVSPERRPKRHRYQGKHFTDGVSDDAHFEPVKPGDSEAGDAWSQVSVPMMGQDAPTTDGPASDTAGESGSDSAATGPISIEGVGEEDAQAADGSDAAEDEAGSEESAVASIPDPAVTDPDPDDVLSSYDLEPGPFEPSTTLADEDPYAATYAPPTPDAPDLPEDTPEYFKEGPQYTLDIAEDVETDRRKNILIAVAIVAAVVCAALGVVFALALGS